MIRKACMLSVIFLAKPMFAANLIDVVHDSLKYNASYLSTKAQSDIARSSYKIARSAWLPQVSLNASKGLNEIRPNPIDGTDQQDLKSLAYGLSLNQKLLDIPSWLGLKQQSYAVQQAILQQQYAKQALMYQVSVSYFDVLQALASYENEKARVKSFREQMRQVRQEFNAGKAAKPSLAQVEAQYLIARAEMVSAGNNVLHGLQKLSQITGRDYNSVYYLNKLPLHSPKPSHVSAWVRMMRKQNLSLKASYSSLMSARQAVEVARAASAPNISFSAGLQRSRPLNFQDPQFGTIRSWSLNLNWPIITGGRNDAALLQSHNLLLQAEQSKIALERDLKQQTISSFYDIKAGIDRINAAHRAVKSANIAMSALKDGYRAGTQTISDVLQSIARRHNASLQLIKAKYSYLSDVLRLKLLIGVLSERDIESLSKLLVRKRSIKGFY